MANLFFSYSHRDEELRNELEVHLAMLKRQGLINTWHDRRIAAGGDIHENIKSELEDADVILLLVSASFLASEYCYEKEMRRALEKNGEGSAIVIPIIIDPCDWHSSEFGALRATPADGKPVSMYANQAEALTEVTKDIRAAIEKMDASKKDVKELKSLEAVAEVVTQTTNQEVIQTGIRSSNLRVKKKFTDREVDDYLDDSFDYISRYFESSLEELQQRNENITAKFKRIDANTFTSSIYDEGTRATECTIWKGAQHSFAGGIAYNSGITTSKNSYSESLSVNNDGYTLNLRSIGNNHFGFGQDDKLSQEGGAELLWGLLIEPLQR